MIGIDLLLVSPVEQWRGHIVKQNVEPGAFGFSAVSGSSPVFSSGAPLADEGFLFGGKQSDDAGAERPPLGLFFFGSGRRYFLGKLFKNDGYLRFLTFGKLQFSCNPIKLIVSSRSGVFGVVGGRFIVALLLSEKRAGEEAIDNEKRDQ